MPIIFFNSSEQTTLTDFRTAATKIISLHRRTQLNRGTEDGKCINHPYW